MYILYIYLYKYIQYNHRERERKTVVRHCKFASSLGVSFYVKIIHPHLPVIHERVMDFIAYYNNLQPQTTWNHLDLRGSAQKKGRNTSSRKTHLQIMDFHRFPIGKLRKSPQRSRDKNLRPILQRFQRSPWHLAAADHLGRFAAALRGTARL